MHLERWSLKEVALGMMLALKKFGFVRLPIHSGGMNFSQRLEMLLSDLWLWMKTQLFVAICKGLRSW